MTHGLSPPSPWLLRWAHLLPPGAHVLDLACGSGRHLRWLAARGYKVTGVDRDAGAVEPLRTVARVVVADIEEGPWPLPGERFDAVLVTNYLWRPLMPTVLDSLAAGGVLLYETFAIGHAAFGRPSNPAFLLREGELLEWCRGMHVVAFEDGLLTGPPRRVQRIVAQCPPASTPPLESPVNFH
ncbi:MAG TPA: class I SAM-dependent methyltransferase [Burkholderiaceae bacterium]|nr:class I SAM-dependent methyltransferase [Burkholderiaceae bacterium]